MTCLLPTLYCYNLWKLFWNWMMASVWLHFNPQKFCFHLSTLGSTCCGQWGRVLQYSVASQGSTLCIRKFFTKMVLESPHLLPFHVHLHNGLHVKPKSKRVKLSADQLQLQDGSFYHGLVLCAGNLKCSNETTGQAIKLWNCVFGQKSTQLCLSTLSNRPTFLWIVY